MDRPVFLLEVKRFESIESTIYTNALAFSSYCSSTGTVTSHVQFTSCTERRSGIAYCALIGHPTQMHTDHAASQVPRHVHRSLTAKVYLGSFLLSNVIRFSSFDKAVTPTAANASSSG
jgi:hypothetical protein